MTLQNPKLTPNNRQLIQPPQLGEQHPSDNGQRRISKMNSSQYQMIPFLCLQK
jgi:hypothetical protein